MLNYIIKFSLRHRGVVVALACLLVGYGLYVTANAKLDVFPNFVPPEVVVQTEAPGLASDQVEALVTQPVESLINGLGNMASLRSESIQGLSVITAVFKEGTDIFMARQMLAEKLAELSGQLPSGVKTPQMSALTSATMDLLKIGLVSEKLSPMELRTFADWTVKPRILTVPGVARCIVFGGEVRQLQILVDPDRLKATGLSISDVLAAAKTSTGIVGAGFVENDNQRIDIQTQGETISAEALGETVVTSHGSSIVRLKDVAKVCEGAEIKFGDAIVNGRQGVLFSTASQYGANTMEVTLALEAALKEMKPVFEKEGVEVYANIHRPATFIQGSIKNITHSLYLGGILVAIVLFIFLGHFRTAFISLTAIPLSLLAAIIVMDKLGITLNTITLGGLAIAIGEVVDDAIIDVENIFRRLRENQSLAQPRPVIRVVFDASIEVRSAVVYATFIVALVFLPVLTLTGLQGSFFAPLALSYILAIMASLAVALTLTPALSLLFFAKGVREDKEPRIQTWLKSLYSKTLSIFHVRRAILIPLLLVLFAGMFVLLPHFGSEFLPEFREGHFVVQMQMAPGTSLPEMVRIGKNIAKDLKTINGIDTFCEQIGRAEAGEDTFGPQRCEFHIELKPSGAEEQETIQKAIRSTFEKYPGMQFDVLTFLGDRISESIGGETAPIIINVFGDDLDQIDAKASEVAKVLSGIKGATDIKVKSPPGAPRVTVKLRQDRIAQFGFHSTDVLESIQTAYKGAIAAQVHQDNHVSDVVVILDEKYRREPESLGSLMLSNPQGLRMPLRELAEVYLGTGRYTIMHEGARRRQVVTCQIEGRDVTSVEADAIKEITAKVKFPKGIYPVFAGAAEAAAGAQHQLMLNSLIAAVGIALLLVVVTGNWRNFVLILANVPFALIGGVVAVYLTNKFSDDPGTGLTIGSLVGFVTLFGITTRNSIMMLSHFEHLVQKELRPWNMETAILGASERLIPILMTAIVTAIGLLPLALGSGEAGREIEGPMAIVILGGLITSTVLNLLVLPTLAVGFGRFNIARAQEDI